MKTWTKRIAVIAIAVAMCLSSVSSLAAGNITWQVKDYITTTGFSGTVGGGLGTGQGGPALDPPYEIVYEQYLDGVSTGLVISGKEAIEYGLKGYASSITRPVSWYDYTYPNLQYAEIYADGQYTGLVWPTGAQLPETSYRNVRYMWEIGGTHKEVQQKQAFLDGVWYADGSYPISYTGTNADVKEENVYFGFDVFEVLGDNEARDVEVVLNKAGNAVNSLNPVKANLMVNAANENEITDGTSIVGLVNSGSGVESVLYKMLANDGAYVAQRKGFDDCGHEVEVPVYNYTGFEADHFDNVLPITHSLKLTGPTYDKDGNVEDAKGLVFDAYDDVVFSYDGFCEHAGFYLCGSCTAQHPICDLCTPKHVAEGNAFNGTSDWDFEINDERFAHYTNNIVTSHATKKAVADWVYAGYEIAEPYRIYEYLSIEGVIFDGDIDNDGVLDTPVIFRYPTSGTANITSAVGAAGHTSGLFDPFKVSYAFADPKVEWRYAFAQAAYPHEIFAEKFVENMNGEMVATGDLRGTGKYAKENIVSLVDGENIEPTAKHYQMRLEWRDTFTRQLYVTEYFDVNEHAAEYVELSLSADPSYIEAIDFNAASAADINLVPTIYSANK